MATRNGTVKESWRLTAVELEVEQFGPRGKGWYVMFGGMWKGPFETKEYAKDAYAEWKFESKHS